jgi:prolipoprotein diacylglyceryl transferase
VDYAYIPSPPKSEWDIPLPFSILGVDHIPIRAYALCIIAGIIVACWITEARLRKRGAPRGFIFDLAIWAVPFGIIGGRIYHLITSPDAYFGSGPDANPWNAFAIWNGGLGIPGAVLLGGVGVWIACRLAKVPFSMVADSLAPGLPLAQAIGRLGNWFNQELFGKPTTHWWGLKIDPIHQTDIPGQFTGAAAYEPTFLYELIWDAGIAGLILWLDRRFKFGAGRAFAIYVLCYGVGRFIVESRRIDIAHAFLGLRVNEWMSVAMVVGAIIYLIRVQGKRQALMPDADGTLHLVDWEQYRPGKEWTAPDTEDAAAADTDADTDENAESPTDPDDDADADEAPADAESEAVADDAKK